MGDGEGLASALTVVILSAHTYGLPTDERLHLPPAPPGEEMAFNEEPRFLVPSAFWSEFHPRTRHDGPEPAYIVGRPQGGHR